RDLTARASQRSFDARTDHDRHTFALQLLHDRAAEPFARGSNDGHLPQNPEIHAPTQRRKYASDFSSQSCRGGLKTSTSSVSSSASALCQTFDGMCKTSPARITP